MAGSTEYKNNWQKEHLDRINLTVPKGYKETIQAHAAAQNESVTAFIQRAICEAIERDSTFADRKDEITRLAEIYKIEDQSQLKKLADAFAALEPVIPDIAKCYFSRLTPPETRVIIVYNDQELNN